MPGAGPVRGPLPPALRAELVEFLAALVRTVRRALAERPNLQRCPEAEREQLRAELRQLADALDTVEQSRTDLFRALAQVRACLQHHAGDDPDVGQAAVVAERALARAVAEGVESATSRPRIMSHR
jgi:ABC-type transporter Mla subunit MlaD